MKKIISTLLTFAIIGSMCFTTAFATDENTSMDNMDVVIAAAVHLNSEDDEERLLPDSFSVEKIIPLYNNNLDIVAYYTSFSPYGYAVVNNNIYNPCAIEFGTGKNEIIESLLLDNNVKIVYNTPNEIFAYNSVSTRDIKNEKDIYSYYTDLDDNNAELQQLVSEYKTRLMNKSRSTTDLNEAYGFISTGELPSRDPITKNRIEKAGNVDWFVWDDFDDYSNYDEDHEKPSSPCPVIAITNLANYFTVCGQTNLLYAGSLINTFSHLYGIHGAGPHVNIASKASTYFTSRGRTLHYNLLLDVDDVVNAIDQGKICMLRLGDVAGWQGHWVAAIGYKNYGLDTYMQINNGWDEGISRYYKANTGSLFVTGNSFYMN